METELHKLLKRQIKKHLTDDFIFHPQFKNFINAVNQSYNSFERDKELMDHAFKNSEEEYQEIYINLKNENFLKQKSVSNLYEFIKILDPSVENQDSEDITELSSYVTEQLKKRIFLQEQLNRQLDLQNLLMDISSEYINIPIEKVSQSVNKSLREMSEFVKADRAYIFKYDFAKNTCSNVFEYCNEEINPQIDNLQDVSLEIISEWVEINKKGGSIYYPNVQELPESNLKDLLQEQDIKSLLVIPTMLHNECLGFVGFDFVKDYHQVSDTEKSLLTIFTQVLVNVRERIFLERNLSRTVEILKNLLANLQFGILMEDENRQIIFTNDLFCKMFNIPVSSDDMIGADCTNSAEQSKALFKNEDYFVQRINEILKEKKIVTTELLETQNERFLERDYIPIFINNHYKGHLWKYNDITERMVTQNLLRQSEERNRMIMDSAMSAIIITNHRGEITFWNKSAVSIFGWTKKEMEGQQITDKIIPNADKNLYRSVLNKQLELNVLKNNGEELTVEMSVIAVTQDNKKHYCYFLKDISERKRAEDHMRRQEEKYRNIIANMNLGLLEVDNNETIRYANQSFCDVSGYEVDELIGKNPSHLFLYGENNIQFVKEQIQLRKKGVSSVYQMPVKNKRGEIRWWAISGAPNYDDNGNQLGSIGIHLDITDQKKLEEDLIQEKANALNASKAKEVFLANMSHEIRTPLNAIIGFLRELKRLDLTTTQSQFVENSYNASQHLLSIINNILDISKIESGEMTLDNHSFSLEESIQKIITILKPKAIQKKIKLEAQFSENLSPEMKGDSLKIEQILFNIVGNSLKFTNKGKVSIECKVLKDAKNYQHISICITDSGIGMSEDYVKNIFKKFNQEDSSISRKYGGTGLGMAITKQLISLMKGEIQIESEKNIGTKIMVILNIDKAKENNLSKHITGHTEEISVKGVNVLLVEDNELNQLVAENSLNYFGCYVTKADNGQDALEILSQQEFDIILIDIQMPELDGIETTKILRNEFKLTTPIVALTANAFKTEIDNCMSAGMNGYITKPFNEEDLLQIIYKHTKAEKIMNKTLFDRNDILYDLNNIQTLSRGNDDFVKKMISIFITQTEETISLIEQAFDKKDNAEIARLVHKIKPGIQGIGIRSIEESVKNLEINAKDKTENFHDLYNSFIEIKATLETAVQQLKTELS
ncbi:PAS domain S-box protein [Elizabethkingia meningoseptica]|uniref:PAS domain S-box protein n=1 Tax=Elizabethkingia meningoseptica TaxID=238 RepID=UPI0022F155FF|nr:PAS domain S-box protein [Elizabethkingia meningoseptica]EJK5329672.1 PAS domain S-box protein [Elizabethkingia meningoseptica]MDE5430895.1 PAS domain S-box protein [Elizabethkingia meningoseptica]MDE5467961.1 PAS domain S-box protein [Elizabethkingia meningoseptica]MDE5474880.1 PAS domain S-box protein [Elizabethkingia meningoseptica]MDE5478313.1 PAS domain S-box protein [Elizabethkingia meningoseptica]